eukprot:ANDGO_07466.mRNA.1 hypothetical protein
MMPDDDVSQASDSKKRAVSEMTGRSESDPLNQPYPKRKRNTSHLRSAEETELQDICSTFVKRNAVAGSQQERWEVETLRKLQSIKVALSIPFHEHTKCVAAWDPLTRRVAVERVKGKWHACMGYFENKRRFFWPEETAFLFIKGFLDFQEDANPLDEPSLAHFVRFMLQMHPHEMIIERIQLYAFLRHQGFDVKVRTASLCQEILVPNVDSMVHPFHVVYECKAADADRKSEYSCVMFDDNVLPMQALAFVHSRMPSQDASVLEAVDLAFNPDRAFQRSKDSVWKMAHVSGACVAVFDALSVDVLSPRGLKIAL